MGIVTTSIGMNYKNLYNCKIQFCILLILHINFCYLTIIKSTFYKLFPKQTENYYESFYNMLTIN